MAKLTKDMQKTVDKADTSGFDPLEPGTYHIKLRDVDTTREGAKGPYWSWEFEVVDDEYKGRRLWNNTSLSPAAAFRMKETFAAFGVALDVDTDELIGKIVKAQVVQRTIQEGARKGEVANDIRSLKVADADVIAQNDDDEKARKDMQEIF